MRRAVFVILAACGGSPATGAFEDLAAAPDIVTSLAFEPTGDEVIAAGPALYRRDGATWIAAPSAGLGPLAAPVRIAIDDDGTAFVVDAEGALYRRTGESWERFDDTATLASTLPVAAADGLRYMLGLPTPGTGASPLLVRGPDDAGWRDTGAAVPVGCTPAPDPVRGVWCDRNDANGNRDGGLVRVDDATTDEIDLAWGAPPKLGDTVGLVGASGGALVGASLGLVPHHGAAFSYDPRSHELERRSSGACDANGTDFDCAAAPGAIVYATLLAPDGELYELWARRDGDAPALLQLDDDRWYVVVPALDGNRFSLAANRDGRVYAYTGTRVLALRR